MTMPENNEQKLWPFHDGELAVQSRLGVTDAVARFAPKFIRPFMPDQHREFFSKLPFVVMAGTDMSGAPWATLRVGAPGFVSSPSATQLDIKALPLAGDPLAGSLESNTKVGLLGIEPATRRRNRMNGYISSLNGEMLSVTVDQSFGNCPQYIQRRKLDIKVNNVTETAVTTMTALNDKAIALIEQADTFFIASRTGGMSDDPRSGVDISHRGGIPGFVKLTGDRGFLFPDYAGNRFYNTLGNIMADSRVGFLFPDFKSGTLLYIIGRAEIIWDQDAEELPAGAERLVTVVLEQAVLVENSLSFSEEFIDYSPIFARWS